MTPRRRLLIVLWFAGAVSVACNILAANPGPVARAVGAWFPVALLLVVHVFGEVRLPAGWPRRAAISGAVVVAVAAAVASFNHMHEIALNAGEPPLVAVLFPLSVDGLAVVASVALAALDRTDPTSDASEPVRAPTVATVSTASSSTPSSSPTGDRPVGSRDRWLVPSLSGAARPGTPVSNGSGPHNNNSNTNHESEVDQ